MQEVSIIQSASCRDYTLAKLSAQGCEVSLRGGLNLLAIFIKYPLKRYVKRRLAKSIGDKAAINLYAQFVKLILRQTEDSRYQRIIFYTPHNREKEFKNWLGEKLFIYPQKGKDLGERMFNAFQFLFSHNVRKVVLIGSDSPLITRKVILEAFHTLDSVNCVLGPSLDGGYYLIGLRKLYKEIFYGISWSTPYVLQQTKEILNKNNIEFVLLEDNLDIDDRDDLYLLKDKLKNKKVYSQLIYKDLRDNVEIILDSLADNSARVN